MGRRIGAGPERVKGMIAKQIQEILNEPFGQNLAGQSRKYVCWAFCRHVYRLLGLPRLKNLQHQTQMKKIDKPVVPCIVLFNMGGDWHSGVVYPDTLHFIHATPVDIKDRNTNQYVACRERLTGWPWSLIIEGYYEP